MADDQTTPAKGELQPISEKLIAIRTKLVDGGFSGDVADQFALEIGVAAVKAGTVDLR